MKKAYLAGQDVFRNNTQEHFKYLKDLAFNYGVIAISPLDNDLVDFGSKQIFKSNIEILNNVDIVIANITPFRGLCADDGTSFEIGYAFGKGLPIYGYTRFNDISMLDYGKQNTLFDDPEFPIYEDFGKCCNLMLYESIIESGGDIFKTYKDCLEAIKG